MKTVLELEDIANKAIKAALNQQWEQAVSLNQEVLEDAPQSVEAYNRLARAYQELGSIDKATEAYQQVLELDPFNSIAQKNLEKLKNGSKASANTISKELFLEEPGKTRSTAIVKPQHKKIEQYSSGEELKLEERKGQLALVSTKGEVLGYLDEDLESHLLKLMKLGNEYSAHLMTTETPQVFLRETKQSAAAAKYVSFTRTSGVAGNFSSPKSLRHDDDSGSTDGIISEEELDNWENDDSDDNGLDENDDFAESLEQLRDEEEGSYSGRDDY